MSAPARRIRIPSSGPFVLPSDVQGDAPEGGAGTPGLIFRYKGAAAQQTYPLAGPHLQDLNFRDYANTVDTGQPAWPIPQVGPFYVDFEAYVRFLSLGTTNVDAELLLSHQFATPSVRTWSQVNIGNVEPLGLLFNERFIYRVDNPALLYDGFRLSLNIQSDVGDVIIDNPNCYAKFQFWQGPVQAT